MKRRACRIVSPGMDAVQVYAGLYEFLDGNLLAGGLSDSVERANGPQTVTIDLSD